MPQSLSSPQVLCLFPPPTPRPGQGVSPLSCFCPKTRVPCPRSSAGPCHTCHLQIQFPIVVRIFHIISSLHSEEVASCVAHPGVADVQGTAVGRGVLKEAESAPSLRPHCYTRFVCGHRRSLLYLVPTPVPVDVEFTGGIPRFPGVGEGAGHMDTLTLLYCHGSIQSELVPWHLLQGTWGDRASAAAPTPPQAVRVPQPLATHLPTAGAAAAGAPCPPLTARAWVQFPL